MSQATGHERIDRRSLAMHRAIAEKLRRQPELMEIARDNLARWSRTNTASQWYWDRWRELLQRPMEELLRVLLEESERMTALRQTSPFAGVLTPQERWAIYAEFASDLPGKV